MRSNLVTAAGEGWLSRLQGWLGQDPPDKKTTPWPLALAIIFSRGRKSLPPQATGCHAGHGTGARRANDPPHVKTNGRQEYVARTTPHSSG